MVLIPISRMYDNTLAAAYLTINRRLQTLDQSSTPRFPYVDQAVAQYIDVVTRARGDHSPQGLHDLAVLQAITAQCLLVEVAAANPEPTDLDARATRRRPLTLLSDRVTTELVSRLEASADLREHAENYAGPARTPHGEHTVEELAHGLVQAGITFATPGRRTPPLRYRSIG